MSDCIFCKIAEGEIPSHTVYEDDDFKAILDISPANPGHTVIIPKRHVENIFELENTDLCEKIFPVVAKLSNNLKESFNPDGLNVLQNNGTAAGQTVFHFHIHLIPRYNNDSVQIKWTPKELTQEELKSVFDSYVK